ncbi:MAG: twin transmembrane helix small protein [Methylophilaceae bacterium]
MWPRFIIIAILIFIAFNLFNALYHLMKGDTHDTSVVKSLTWRVGLSIGLFLLLMLGFYTGVISGHAVLP